MPVSYDGLHRAEPSPAARRLLWTVLSAGRVSRDEPEVRAGHDKPGGFLFWVWSGRGTLEYCGRTFMLRPGPQCWLLDLRHPRSYVPAPGSKLVTQGLRFDGPGVEAWLELVGADNEFRLVHPEDLSSIRRAHREILNLIRNQPPGYEWQVHLWITQILGVLLKTRGLLSGAKRPAPPAVIRVVDAVNADPARRWQARELAAVAGVSYSTLRVQFRQTQGETLKQFVQRVRVEQARLRLCDLRRSCKDIALELNFSSEFEFSHFFRRATGLSPTEFRRLWRSTRI